MTTVSNEAKTDIRKFLDEIVITTPRDVSGDDVCCEPDNCDCEADCDSMQLTVSIDNTGTHWSYQTGDNSFTGGAYNFPHWAVTYIGHDSDRNEIHNEIIDQLEELL